MIQIFKRIPAPLPVLLALWLGMAQAASAQISVSAHFEPALIHADEHSMYVLQINGAQGGISGDMPELQGLKVIGPQQTGNSVSIINGVTSMQRSIRIPMGADAAGDYSVPAFEIEVSGQRLSVPQARLQVLPVDEVARTAAAASSPVKLQMQLPQGPYYVGQAIPVTLSLNSDPQVSLSGGSAPVKSGTSNYMLSPFSELGSRRTEAGGQIVNQYRMGAVVTPLTSGDMSLGFEQTVLAYIPPQLRADGRGRNNSAMANDPFAQFFGRDSMFDRMTNREELHLKTQSQALKIESLPAEGKPRDFSGAIGQFQIGRPALSHDEVKVGEPVTLSFSVEGSGNFDRIQPPPIPDGGGQWRSYTPQSQFEPQDPVGYSGRKTFEYTLIPRSEAVNATPQIDFSYFDPISGAYVDLPIPPLPISVTPGTDAVGARAVAATQPPASSTQAGDLLPLMQDSGQGSGSLNLLFRSPVFYSVQALPALALIGFILYRRHRLRLENDPRFARRHFARRRIRQALEKARAQVAAGDSHGFYQSAAAALQEVLSVDEPDIAAASLASGELESRLLGLGASAEDVALARLFLHESDALQYGSATAATPLARRLQELEQLLQKLEKAPAAAKPSTR